MPERHEVCPASELPPGERRIVEIEGLPHSIGVFNVDGEYHALANVCPHQLAPLCLGRITGEMTSEGVGDYQLVRDGEVIQCPWHGWKFDIATGTSLFNPHAAGPRTYEARVERSGDPPTGERAGDPPNEERADDDQVAAYGTVLAGDEPPVDSYAVDVEEDVVVVYV